MNTPAYLVASSIMPKNHGSFEAYGKAASAIFEQYGAQAIAMGGVGGFAPGDHGVEVVKDEWTKDASLTIFRFPSMTALKECWHFRAV